MKKMSVVMKKVLGIFTIEEYVFSKKDSVVKGVEHKNQENWIKMFATLR